MARVPLPRGRPRRPVPEPFARALRARRGAAEEVAGGAAAVADAGQGLLGGLEAVVLVDERAQLLETLRDLLALFLKEVGHSATLS